MFGYIIANTEDLSQDEKDRYRQVYCGLCHELGKRHGQLSRFSLNYDMTFLVLLLSSLYEPREDLGTSRCAVHPCKKHSYAVSTCTEYAADMTVALSYYKCVDDWNDDKKLSCKCYASVLNKQYEKVKRHWPEQCSVIEQSIAKLSAIEKEQPDDPDAAADCFGRLMEVLFIYRKDRWENHLRELGYGLGRYIYLADAAVDLESDIKHNNYNPLKTLESKPEELRPTLMMVLGEASRAFEALPLVQDIHLLRNILYSGLWIKYNQSMQKDKKVKK